MNAIPHERYEILNSASDANELRAQIQGIVMDLGFDGFIYSTWVEPNRSIRSSNSYSLTSYRSEVLELYKSNQHLKFDPAADFIRENKVPKVWGAHFFNEPLAHASYMEAKSFGVCSGASFPVSTSADHQAMFSWSTGAPYEQVVSSLIDAIPYGQLLAIYIHAAVSRLQSTQTRTEIELNITGREKACLRMAIHGQRDVEIAENLGITTRTVLFHLSNARKKLNAKTRSQMIAHAFARNVVDL